MLDDKHFSGSSKSCLDFISNHENAVLVTNLPYALDKLFRWDYKSAFSLDRLYNNSGHILSRHFFQEEFLDLLQDHVIHIIWCPSLRSMIIVRIGKFVRIGCKWAKTKFV